MWDEEKTKALENINNILFKTKGKMDNVIFIYTPPKVGSTSLVSSIRISAANKYSVLHIHDEVMLNVLTGCSNISINEIIHYNKKIGKNVFVIDIYRTPIERKISEYFEKLSCHHFNNTDENLNNYNIKKIINRFNKLFPHLASQDYFHSVYNIEIPSCFDFEKKYLHVIKNGINYIKLRLYDSSMWNKILSDLLQTEIVIVHDYETEKKKIGDLYKKFKANYQIPVNLWRNIQECPYFNYYLSSEEKKTYNDFWGKKVGEAVIPYTKNQYDFYMQLCLENKFYNDFQHEHYMDVGCMCRPCSQKRIELFNKAKRGEKVTDRIIHEENVLNLQKNIVKSIQEKFQKKKNNNFAQSRRNNNKPINGLLNSIVNTKW